MKLQIKHELAKDENIKQSRVIRLFYVAMEKFKRYSTNGMCIGHTYGISSPFILPDGMTIEDANKVISYLTDKIERENNMLTCSERAVALVSAELDNYGFQRVEDQEHGHFHAVDEFDPFRRIRSVLPVCQRFPGVVDLFTVSGDVRLFEKSDLNPRYFNWYTSKVSKADIENIYKSIGREDILQSAESNLSEME